MGGKGRKKKERGRGTLIFPDLGEAGVLHPLPASIPPPTEGAECRIQGRRGMWDIYMGVSLSPHGNSRHRKEMQLRLRPGLFD